MWVVLAQHLSHHACALAKWLARLEAKRVHGKEDAALHGLQAVAHVGEGTADDDRHGILLTCNMCGAWGGTW